MASAEQLRIAHSVEGKVMGVDERVQGVGDDVQNVGKKVEDVDDRLHGVDGKIQGIDDEVKDVGARVQGLDCKLDDASRLSSLGPLRFSKTQTCSQGTSSAIISYDGFHLQIHPEIIISHPKLITMAQLNGFFKAIYSTIGSPLVPSCGYMENVCSFYSSL